MSAFAAADSDVLAAVANEGDPKAENACENKQDDRIGVGSAPRGHGD